MKYRFYDDEDEGEVELPHRNEVCPRCQGEGTHDCWEGGMTGDEMAEQGPEFYEDYMNGVYSKLCTECDGRRVVQVIDRDRTPPDLLARYDAQEKEIRDMEAMYEAERRMGA